MKGDCFTPESVYNKAVIFIHNNKWFIHGYKDDGGIDTIGGWDTFAEYENAKLYGKDGNEIHHEYSNIPTLEEQVRSLSTALLEMAGEIYD